MEGFVVTSHGSTWSTQGSQPGLSIIACFLILPFNWQKSHNPESEWNSWLGRLQSLEPICDMQEG